MHTVSIQILRFTDTAQPGWVECLLRDASDREWLFEEKVPMVSDTHLNADSIYPQRGVIACEIVHRRTDERGRMICTIDTERPWGLAAKTGQTQFDVFSDQIMTSGT
jgi:hypothetical protein